MASLDNPKAWVPYMKTKDCSQGFCSLYCPQWCYTMFTPPPPPFVFREDNSGPMFSPLVIAIIGILASAFLLVSYYAIISKYCGNRRDPSSTRTENHHVPDEEELEESTQDPSNHETWYVSNSGLDEALIKSITVCKYKKGGGLIELTDCSVCLGEFQEDESLRLLPKCSHAFHVNCIDTWLKSHSNCPLCRASIGFINPMPIFLPPPPPPPPLYRPLPPPLPFLYDDSDSDSSQILERQEPCAINHSSVRRNNNAFPLPPPPPPPPPPLMYDDSDTDSSQSPEWHDPQLVNCSLERRNDNAASTDIGARDEEFTSGRASSDLGNSMERDSIIEIREEQGRQQIRRSVSMNHSCQAHLSLADVLFINQDEEFQFQRMEECRVQGEVGSSKGGDKGMIKFRNRNRVLSCVFSRPLAMKRSFSSGRLFTRRERMRNVVIPL